MRRIERSTPFYKSGQLQSADLDDEIGRLLAKMRLQDLDIDVSAKIGEGAYGNVYRAVHLPTETALAVKKVPKSSFKKPSLAQTLKREIQIHKKLKHQNIVRLFTDLQDTDYIYLVMEYVPKNNLFKNIPRNKGLPEQDVFWFFIQTVQGIYFLHEQGFIHRDLKPENLLVSR